MEEMESILYEGKGHLIEFKESMSDSLAKGMVAFHVHILNSGGLVKGISPDEFGLISISRNQFLQGYSTVQILLNGSGAESAGWVIR